MSHETYHGASSLKNHPSEGNTDRRRKEDKNISECPETHAQWYCLNGASCFAIKVQNSTLYNCWCLAGFHGPRCDYKYIRPTAISKQLILPTAAPPTNGSISDSNTAVELEEQPSFIIRVSDEPKQLQQQQQPGFDRFQISKTTNHHWLFAYNALILSFLIMIVLIILFLTIRKRFNEGNQEGEEGEPTTMGRFVKAVNEQEVVVSSCWTQETTTTTTTTSRNNRQINHDSSSSSGGGGTGSLATTMTPVIGLEIIGQQQPATGQQQQELHLHQANHSSYNNNNNNNNDADHDKRHYRRPVVDTVVVGSFNARAGPLTSSLDYYGVGNRSSYSGNYHSSVWPAVIMKDLERY